jgi:hypothetical protein
MALARRGVCPPPAHSSSAIRLDPKLPARMADFK